MPPERRDLVDELLGERLVAGDVAGVEQTEDDLHVRARHLHRFASRPHAVVEMEPGVPNRVPDGVRDALDVAPPAMQQHDVEVASWAEERTAHSPRPRMSA